MDTAARDPAAPTPRSADLVLARAHLRLGSLALARAELETLAGRDALDEDGVLDLAEARWRTGDVIGAGEAAELLIEDDRGPLIALIIAAEAAMAVGRPSEARPYVARAVEQAGAGLDAIFAGMPRTATWPPDPLVPPPTAMPLFEPGPAVGRAPAAAVGAAGVVAPEPAVSGVAGPAEAPIGGAAAAGAIGLWDHAVDAPAASDGTVAAAASPPASGSMPAEPPAPFADTEPAPGSVADLPSGGASLALGRQALAEGDRRTAAIQLGLAIRLDPSLAPAVVALLEADRSPDVALVRGDAYRLVGREQDARQAFADAAGIAAPTTDAADALLDAPSTDPSIHDDRGSDEPPPQGDPA